MKFIVIVTGPVCSGKSSLSRRLRDCFGWDWFRTKDALILRGGKRLRPERRTLQEFGEELDRSNIMWLVEDLDDFAGSPQDPRTIVLDSPRNLNQIKIIRHKFGVDVLHVHLLASRKVLERRYEKSGGREGITELSSSDEVIKNNTETDVNLLSDIADVVINTEQSSVEEAAFQVFSWVQRVRGDTNQISDAGVE